eukprot:gene9746-9904_t
MADGSAPVCAAHHISNEPMSELSYAVYMARRLPVSLLVRVVRRRFRPQEFPASLGTLYASSPDEALPQFYTSEEVWPAHRDKLRALAVDPGERLIATAGRSGVRDASAAVAASAIGAPVVRVWECADAEAKVQYTGHAAAVTKVAFLGSSGSSTVASLDVSGALHVWCRMTGG